MRTKFIIGIVVIITAASYFYFFNPFSNPDGIQSTAFYGGVQRVEGGKVYLNGNFMAEDDSFIDSESVNATIKTDRDTKFIKSVYYAPPREEIKAAGGVWYPQEARKETVDGDIGDFIPGMSVTVRTNNNIYGDKTITADAIYYFDIVYPDSP